MRIMVFVKSPKQILLTLQQIQSSIYNKLKILQLQKFTCKLPGTLLLYLSLCLHIEIHTQYIDRFRSRYVLIWHNPTEFLRKIIQLPPPESGGGLRWEDASRVYEKRVENNSCMHSTFNKHYLKDLTVNELETYRTHLAFKFMWL